MVKELLDNAIDAGAANIHLHLEEGGISQIRIQDDGDGIKKDELPLALARHATNKISSFDDLLQVASMGFRGEALAAISSIAKVTVKSRHREAEAAYSITSNHSSSEQPYAARSAPPTTPPAPQCWWRICTFLCRRAAAFL